MKEKEVLIQLNKLKSLKPDERWKRRNRDILLHQVFGGEIGDVGAELSGIKISFFSWAIKSLSQPVMAVVLILVFMLGSGILSIRAARNTKPGDSLYIAKIISERTQFAFTFGEKEKARLGIEFAGNRAKEITQVLAETDKKKNREIEKLVNDFRKEISEAMVRLKKISRRQAGGGEMAAAKRPVADESGAPVADESGHAVFSANLGRDERGIEVGEAGQKTAGQVIGSDSAMSGTDVNTTIPELIGAASSSFVEEAGPADTGGRAEKILQEAEELLNKDNYGATLNKLEEAGQAIDRVNRGEIRGVEEYSTSTDDTLGSEVNAARDLPAEEASTSKGKEN